MLHLFAFLSHAQIELSLQLDRLLLLVSAILDLSIVPLQLHDDLLLFEFQLARVSLDLLFTLGLFIGLLLIVDLPGELHVFLLLSHSFLRHHLLLLNTLQQLIPIKLLQILTGLQMMLKPLLIGHLGLILLPVEQILSDEQLLVVLFDGVVELGEASLHLLLFDLFGTAGHRVHTTVGFLGLFNLLVQVLDVLVL